MRFLDISSERLTYRKFTMDDFPIVHDWLSNPENMKYRRGEPRTEAETRDYLAWAIENAQADECRNFEYAVVRKSDNRLIGAATLMHLPNDPEIGWTLHRDYFQQGYGTEIGRTMLKLGFDTLNLRRIIAGCNAQNRGSYRILEKIGMRREACFVKAQRGGALLNHEWCDRAQYAILQEEWQTLKNECE